MLLSWSVYLVVFILSNFFMPPASPHKRFVRKSSESTFVDAVRRKWYSLHSVLECEMESQGWDEGRARRMHSFFFCPDYLHCNSELLMKKH